MLALLFTASALAAAAIDDLAPPAAGALAPAQIEVAYTGSVFILPVAEIHLNAVFPDDSYSAAARFQSAGLLRWFDDTDITAEVSGYRDGAVLDPWRYSHVNAASNKGRVVGINFADGVAQPDINPPFGSMGEPPASDEERAGAVDPISALLSLSLSSPALTTGACAGRLPVFDGKARYDLRLENGGRDGVRTRGYRGQAVVCRAFLEPINGYDPGDRPEADELENPVTMWLAPIDGVFVPVRYRAPAPIGEINIKAHHVSVVR